MLTKRFSLLLSLGLLAGGCAAQGDADSTGGGNVGFGGAQDIGQFRGILESGGIPGSATLDANGFFNEHYIESPAGDCGDALCMQGLVSVNRDWIGNDYQAVLRVALTTEVSPADLTEKPLDLVVVVDTSGSMLAGDRLEYVIDGLELLIENLGENDRLGIVGYASGAQILASLDGSQNKEELLAIVRGLAAQGGTNIYSGLEAGMMMAASELSVERQSRVILLSDGNITVGRPESDVRTVSETYISEGIGLTTIGVGSDFNVELMRGLAERGAGNFYFLEDPSAVREVFTEELAYFSQPIALGLEVNVSSHESHRFGEIFGTSLWESNGESGSMSIPAVFLSSRVSETPGEEGRRGGGSSLFIEMNPQEINFEGETLATLTLSYHLPGSAEQIVQEVVVDNPFRDEAPKAGYVSHESMLKGYAMYNVFLGLSQATAEAEYDYSCAVATLDTLATKTRNWNEVSPDEDIAADLVLIDSFRQNLVAVGGDPSYCGQGFSGDDVYYDDHMACSTSLPSRGLTMMSLFLLAGFIGLRRRPKSDVG